MSICSGVSVNRNELQSLLQAHEFRSDGRKRLSRQSTKYLSGTVNTACWNGNDVWIPTATLFLALICALSRLSLQLGISCDCWAWITFIIIATALQTIFWCFVHPGQKKLRATSTRAFRRTACVAVAPTCDSCYIFAHKNYTWCLSLRNVNWKGDLSVTTF